MASLKNLSSSLPFPFLTHQVFTYSESKIQNSVNNLLHQSFELFVKINIMSQKTHNNKHSFMREREREGEREKERESDRQT